MKIWGVKMKRFIKKIVSVMLVLILSLSCFSGCIETADEAYMLKGEFFNAFINYFNYSPEGATLEQMNDSDSYDIEAMTMEAWGLLDYDDANKKLTKPITKEIAVIACLNEVYLKKTGNIDDIKDADLCDHPQLVADAIATGITELDNGYFNGDEKLTYEECQFLLKNTMKAIVEGRVEDEDSYINYAAKENSIGLSDRDLGEDDFIILNGVEDDTSEVARDESIDLSAIKSPTATSMNLASSDEAKVRNTTVPLAPKYASCTVSAGVYMSKFKDAKEGDYIIYTGKMSVEPIYGGKISTYTPKENFHVDDLETFAGYFVSATKQQQYDGSYRYKIRYRVAEETEIIAETNIVKTFDVNNIDFEPIEEEVAGFTIKLEPNTDKSGIIATASKTFTISENIKKNWQDAVINPTATLTTEISNISVTMTNVDAFFKDSNDTGSVKVQCNTTEEFTMESGGMRYVPDNNRNAKFWTKLTKTSRFTSGQGAQRINITRKDIPIEIPYTGLTIYIRPYLCIEFDGKISIEFSQVGNGFKIEKKAGKIHISGLDDMEPYKEADGVANIDIGVEMEVSLGCFLLTQRFISGSVKVGFDIENIFSVYHGNENKLETGLVADKQEADMFAPLTGLKYCFNLNAQLYIEMGLLSENLLGKLLKDKYDLSKLKVRIAEGVLPSFELHLEESGFVDKCTHTDAIVEEISDYDTQAASDGKFVLSSTKVHMTDGTCSMVYIKGMPISNEKIEKKYINGIQVKSRNENIVEVSYNEKSNSIMITTVGPGSTEVDVYLRKDKVSGKEYMQTFSVTVFDNPDIKYSSFTVGDFEDIKAIKI